MGVQNAVVVVVVVAVAVVVVVVVVVVVDPVVDASVCWYLLGNSLLLLILYVDLDFQN